MGRRCAACALAILPLLSGCDFSFSFTFFSGDFGPSAVPVTLTGDAATDGDVRADGAVATAGAIRAGVDPLALPPVPEYRGFVSFPIGGIPPGAWVESATVRVAVDRVDLSGAGLVLAFDHVRYGSVLTSAAFDAPGSRVGGLPSGVTLFPAANPQFISFDVAPELQVDVNDSLRFFQLRVRGTGGLARIVDGAGNRAGGFPADPALAPVLNVVYRP